MDIILHLGAHRTGTTTFQRFVHKNRALLGAQNISYWGPKTTRKGLFEGVIPNAFLPGPRLSNAERGEGRVEMRLYDLNAEGCQTLLVSDENFMGSVRGNLRDGEIYPAIGERMARYSRAFGHDVAKIVLCIRSLDTFWASGMAFSVARGHNVVGQKKVAEIANTRRSWRDVITDLACAVPNADIRVMPFESHRANPNTVLSDGMDINCSYDADFEWTNRSPDISELRQILSDRGQDPDQIPEGTGAWMPFSDAMAQTLQEQYADDLFWLSSGADGLARLTQDLKAANRGKARQAAFMRGQDYDEKGQLEDTG
ncbi:MAG: hypothetical protein AB8B71_01290 [Paracoccaceae bacterium]